jgi:putative RNA 2'-phosphotransferase
MNVTKKEIMDLGIFMSYVLRHGAKKEKINIDSNGWVSIDDLIFVATKYNHICDLLIIKHIVENNSKKRYELSNDCLFIRAFQGHSEKSVTIQHNEKKPPELLFHGTSVDNVHSIKKDGIKKMSRLHVHLSEDLKTARKVGIRHAKSHDKLIILEISAIDMEKNGYKFYLSENDVWLTEHVPAQYINNKF